MPFFSSVISANKSKAVSRIDTTDLMFYYEPANSSSYSGTGTDLNSVFTPSAKTLTLSGGPVYNANGWFTYDGVNDQAKESSIFSPTTVEHTIVAWANPDSLNGDQYFVWDTQLYGGSLLACSFGNFSGVGEEIRLLFRNSGGIDLTSNTRMQGTQYVNIGDWTFLVARYYSNGDIKLSAYNRTTSNIDHQTETGYSAASVPTPKILAIGAATYNAAFFNGKIGEVACYDRVITDTEVQTIFDNTKARYGY